MIDPAILMSVWLYATLEGVGSARLLDRLSKSAAAHLWLVGGVTVNYHTQADFRTAAGPLLGRTSVELGGGEVETLAVDGMRLQRAGARSAGAAAEGAHIVGVSVTGGRS